LFKFGGSLDNDLLRATEAHALHVAEATAVTD
jgi:hypothetical protein